MTKIITTSEGSYLGMAFRDNLEKHPEVFVIPDDIAVTIEKKQAVRRAAEDAAKPKEPIKVELARLRNQLFLLEQGARGSETRVNNTSGQREVT